MAKEENIGRMTVRYNDEQPHEVVVSNEVAPIVALSDDMIKFMSDNMVPIHRMVVYFDGQLQTVMSRPFTQGEDPTSDDSLEEDTQMAEEDAAYDPPIDPPSDTESPVDPISNQPGFK